MDGTDVPREPPPPREAPGLSTLAIVIIVLAAILGLVMVAMAIAFFVFISSFGSNK